MKKYFFACIAIVCCQFILSTNGFSQNLILKNNSALQRKNSIVEIPWSQVLLKYPSIDTNALVITQVSSKKIISYQYEYQGTAHIQNLLVEVSIPANSSIQLHLSKGKRPFFETKTYCRFVPERKDDFAWENDKIAHRMYGKALEATPKENAYGTDVWSKRTPKMIINEWYSTNKYHDDNGTGLDYYHVGYFLGAGDIAPILKDSIWFPKNYTRWKVLDNGPLRSSFILYYDAWNVDGKATTVSKQISIDAGSQLSKVIATYDYDGNQSLALAIGISRRAEAGAILLNEQKGILGYWEPTHGKDGTIGVACILPHTENKMSLQKGHLLATVTSTAHTPFTYYKGAAWTKMGDIHTSEEWFQYLVNFETALSNPIVIQ
ncbi:MAG: DUF4861 domain-containing protein [Chitinophagia bacterium]|jgi:hypothetical protein|nr:DUF4861 domain-containing protein [Chitinophagia bacterium]